MKNILAVEDNLAQAGILAFAIKAMGHNPISAYSSEEALEILEKRDDIDLITLDINLPGKNGLVLLGELKEDERYKKIPIVVISALNQEHNIQRAFDLGADDYITKPVDIEKLKLILRRHLE